MIIGITGTNGAGKGTVVAYLIKKGFVHYSGRGFITEEVRRRGIELNRDSLNLVGNDLRNQYGASYIAEQLLTRAKQQGKDAVIESIRSVGEAEYLKSNGALLWGVNADRKIRYERSVLRGSETDKVSFKDFCKQEDRELNAAEKYNMNILGVMKMADAILTNDGTEKELFLQVEKALKTLGK